MLENTFSIETVKCSRFYSILTEDGRYSYFCFSNVLVSLFSLFSPRFYFTLCVLRLSLLWFCFAPILCCYMRFMIIEYFPIQWNHFVRIVLPYFQRSGGFVWLLFFFSFGIHVKKPKAHHRQAAFESVIHRLLDPINGVILYTHTKKTKQSKTTTIKIEIVLRIKRRTHWQ